MKILPDRLMVRKGTFYFRLWVPKDIVPFYGRQLVVTSLRTKDLKTAKSRLARKTVEADEHFEELRSEKRLSSIAMTAADQLVHQSAFPEIVSSHAREARDREFEQRSNLYTSAISDPMRLWSGDLLPLPSPSDFGHGEADAYTYFDHLVADGDLDKVIGYLNRFRLFTRIKDLKRMRATGDIGTFIAVAHERLSGLDDRAAVSLARLLLEAELSTFEAILGGEPLPQAFGAAVEGLKSASPTVSPPDASALKGDAVSLKQVFQKWEAETDPS